MEEGPASGKANNILIYSLTFVHLTLKHSRHFKELSVLFEGKRKKWGYLNKWFPY